MPKNTLSKNILSKSVTRRRMLQNTSAAGIGLWLGGLVEQRRLTHR